MARNENSDKTEDTRMVSRRVMLRISAGAVGGLIAGGAFYKTLRGDKPALAEFSSKVTINSECVACTGCVSACPVEAISIAAGAIEVSDHLCISCGYCVAACPVGGIVVNRKTSNG